jgi:hypothetical protein
MLDTWSSCITPVRSLMPGTSGISDEIIKMATPCSASQLEKPGEFRLYFAENMGLEPIFGLRKQSRLHSFKNQPDQGISNRQGVDKVLAMTKKPGPSVGLTSSNELACTDINNSSLDTSSSTVGRCGCAFPWLLRGA